MKAVDWKMVASAIEALDEMATDESISTENRLNLIFIADSLRDKPLFGKN